MNLNQICTHAWKMRLQIHGLRYLQFSIVLKSQTYSVTFEFTGFVNKQI